MFPTFYLVATHTLVTLQTATTEFHENSTTPGIDQDKKSQIVQGAIGTGVVLIMVVLSVGFMIRKKKLSKHKDDSKNEEGTNYIIIVVGELSTLFLRQIFYIQIFKPSILKMF